MFVEFVGLTFFSFLTITISNMFMGNQSFETMMNARMQELDLWLLRLENCNKEEKLPTKMYHLIKETITDAFVYDYNLIMEEFSFFNELPADLRNRISDLLFKPFKNNFSNFFTNTDLAFQNYLIVNMFCRLSSPGKTLIQYGQKFSELYFISKGSVVLYDQQGVTPFLQLPKHSYFGDYQILFDLRANFTVKVGGIIEYDQEKNKMDRTFFLCVKEGTFNELCKEFPKSKYVIQKQSLERRKVFMEVQQKMMHYLKQKQQVIN